MRRAGSSTPIPLRISTIHRLRTELRPDEDIVGEMPHSPLRMRSIRLSYSPTTLCAIACVMDRSLAEPPCSMQTRTSSLSIGHFPWVDVNHLPYVMWGVYHISPPTYLLLACFVDTLMPMQCVHEHSKSNPTTIPYCLQETGKESGNTTLGVYIFPYVMVVYPFTHHPCMYRQYTTWYPVNSRGYLSSACARVFTFCNNRAHR